MKFLSEDGDIHNHSLQCKVLILSCIVNYGLRLISVEVFDIKNVRQNLI
jgi:hypothetical protein